MTVSINSKKVYHEEIKGAKEETQDEQMLRIVKELEPCTAIAIEKAYPHFKINVITRCLNNLREKKKLIEVYFSAKCKHTQRTAAHYRVIPK
jgi:hypothetical protein